MTTWLLLGITLILVQYTLGSSLFLKEVLHLWKSLLEILYPWNKFSTVASHSCKFSILGRSSHLLEEVLHLWKSFQEILHSRIVSVLEEVPIPGNSPFFKVIPASSPFLDKKFLIPGSSPFLERFSILEDILEGSLLLEEILDLWIGDYTSSVQSL